MHFKAILVAVFATTVLAVPALENNSKKGDYCCTDCDPPRPCTGGKSFFFTLKYNASERMPLDFFCVEGLIDDSNGICLPKPNPE